MLQRYRNTGSIDTSKGLPCPLCKQCPYGVYVTWLLMNVGIIQRKIDLQILDAKEYDSV